MRILPTVSILVAVAVLADEPARSAPLNERAALPVVCPAIQHEAVWRPSPTTSEFGALALPSEAIVRGRLRLTNPDPTTMEPRAELIVEKTEAGHCPLRRIPLSFAEGWPVGPALYDLRATLDPKRPLVRLATTDLRQTKSHQALWSARFDYRVLSSKFIFVGKLTRILDEQPLVMVEVLRPIHGQGPPKGAVLPCTFPDIRARIDPDTKLVDDSPRLFFVESTFHVRYSTADEARPKCPYYKVNFAQAVRMEREVRAAVRRRPLYPTSDVEIGPDDNLLTTVLGPRPPTREIIFRGPIDDALDFLGSEDYRVRMLGYASLYHRRNEAKPELLADLRKSMQDLGVGPDRHRRLYHLIRLLALSESADRHFASMRKLIDEHLENLEWLDTNVPPNESPDQFDHNRALEWLVGELPGPVAYRHYSARLTKLAGQLSGNSRQRLRAIANEAGFDDQRELAEALLQPETRRLAKHHSPWLETQCCRGTFSSDGKYFAQATSVWKTPGSRVRIWKVGDWSEVRTLSIPGFVFEQLFSPDGRWLYLALGDAADRNYPQKRAQRLCRIDCKTGRVDREYFDTRIGSGKIRLSSDGSRLAICVESDKFFEEPARFDSGRFRVRACEIRVFDTRTGKVLGSVLADSSDPTYRLHPSGKWLVHRVADGPQEQPGQPRRFRWKAESLGAKPPRLPAFEKKDDLVFVNERYLLTTEQLYVENASPPEVSTLFTLRDLSKNNAVVQSVELPYSSCVVESSDGNLKVSAVLSPRELDEDTQQTGELAILDVPTLKVIRRTKQFAEGHDAWREPVFRPQSDIAVFENDSLTKGPVVVELGTGKRTPLDSVHRSEIRSVEFTDSGQLLTRSADNRLCWWDAKSLRPKTKLGIPNTSWVKSCRPPKADVIAYIEIHEDKLSKLRLVDTHTGKVMSSFAFDWRSGQIPKVLWNDSHEAILLVDSPAKNEDRLFRIDTRTGKKLADFTFEGFGYWTTEQLVGDRIRLLHIDSESRKPLCSSKTIDIRTGQASPTRTIPWLDEGTAYGGLVPGKSWGWLGLEPMRLVDWATGKQLTQRRFPNCAIFDIEFSPDGSRYALSCRMPLQDDRVSSWLTPSVPEPVVRIHETRTGKLLVAFRPSHEARLMRFDPSGKHLALVTMSQSLEVWRLSR